MLTRICALPLENKYREEQLLTGYADTESRGLSCQFRFRMQQNHDW